jgi:branched-chain amino acid transport system ATP-binding protein/branched-chain amino acid transport system permease protein
MDYLLGVLTLIAIWMIAVQGYMLIKGLAGLLHLGHAVFFGLGAYTAAILSRSVLPAGSYLLSISAAALVGALGGLAIGAPALRAQGRYFMLVTFSVQLMFISIVSNLHGLTGGPDGLSRIPRPQIGPWTVVSAPATLALVAVLALTSFVLSHLIIISPYGRLVRAVRDDELAAEALGKHPTSIKLTIFAIGAAIAGFGGGVFAHYMRYVGPSQFSLDLVILFLVMLVLGGQFSLAGVMFGTFLVGLLIEALRFLPLPHGSEAFLHQVVFGSLLVAVLFVRPEGLVRERFPRYRRAVTACPSANISTPNAMSKGELGPLLRADGLVKKFGGVAALNDCSFDIPGGRITAIIGPNGAGKTTIFNLLTGFFVPDSGQVYYRNEPLVGHGPARIATVGVARTFQDVRIWQKLTVIENILVAMPGPWGGRPFTHERRNEELAWHLLERFGLELKANDLGGALSYAQQKMLALARLMALDPEIMLLDEPTSGVDAKRIGPFLDHIRRFCIEQSRTVCLIEHNMDVVRGLADHVIFVNEGRVLASGTPTEVIADAALMRIYLGYRASAA